MHPELRRIVNTGIGRVEADQSFDGGSFCVVHVLQAYENPLALRRVAEIVAELVAGGVASLLCIEEFAGEVPLAPLEAWRARRANFPTPARLVEIGEIGYLEYLFLVNDRALALRGVEDALIYRQAQDLDRALAPGKDSWARRIQRLVTELHSEGLGAVSPEYAEFLRSCGPGGTDELPPFEILAEYAHRLGLESAELLNYGILRSVDRLEKAIDFAAVNREREELQNLLVNLVTDSDLIVQSSFEAAGLATPGATPQALVEGPASKPSGGSSVAARMRRTPLGRILLGALRCEGHPGRRSAGPAELLALFERSFSVLVAELADVVKDQTLGHEATGKVFNLLMDVMALLNVEQERFPNLVLYAHYVNRFLSTRLGLGSEELKGLKLRILAALARSETDRLHAGLSVRLRLLGGAFQLSLTRRDAKSAQAVSRELSHGQLCSELGSLLKKSVALTELRALEAEYADRFDAAMRFYSFQDLRADAMVAETLAAMRAARRDAAILVTGGFHQETIATNLTRHRISHTVVYPTGMPTGPDRRDSTGA